MTDRKHTPGPWILEGDENSGLRIWAHAGQTLVSECGFGTESAFNAHLIASAPDLLELLIRCVIEWDALGVAVGAKDVVGNPTDDLFRAARAAITKATTEMP